MIHFFLAGGGPSPVPCMPPSRSPLSHPPHRPDAHHSQVPTHRLRHVPLFPANFNPGPGLRVEGYLLDCWWPGEVVEQVHSAATEALAGPLPPLTPLPTPRPPGPLHRRP